MKLARGAGGTSAAEQVHTAAAAKVVAMVVEVVAGLPFGLTARRKISSPPAEVEAIQAEVE